MASRSKRRRGRQQKQQHSRVAVADARGADPHGEPIAEAATLDLERWVVVKEIAERLGVTPQGVRKWAREGKLPLRKLFGSTGPLGMTEAELVAGMRGQWGRA